MGPGGFPGPNGMGGGGIPMNNPSIPMGGNHGGLEPAKILPNPNVNGFGVQPTQPTQPNSMHSQQPNGGMAFPPPSQNNLAPQNPNNVNMATNYFGQESPQQNK